MGWFVEHSKSVLKQGVTVCRSPVTPCPSAKLKKIHILLNLKELLRYSDGLRHALKRVDFDCQFAQSEVEKDETCPRCSNGASGTPSGPGRGQLQDFS